MQDLTLLINKLYQEHHLEKEEWIMLIRGQTPELSRYLFSLAREVRHRYYGHQVWIRGLIEFTNYCRNDCYYCGIRAGNRQAKRYRLTQEQILSCCRAGYQLGFRTFVLQGGEDLWFTDEKICQIVRSIKEEFSDCAVTLSIGERSRESYQAFF